MKLRRNSSEMRFLNNLDRHIRQNKEHEAYLKAVADGTYTGYVPTPRVSVWRPAPEAQIDFTNLTVRSSAESFDFGAAIRREMAKLGVQQ